MQANDDTAAVRGGRPASACAADGCVCVASAEFGVAMSGGGAMGLAELGALKVLDRADVPVGYVAGTSAGAIIGAVYVTSQDASEAEDRVLRHLRSTGIGFNVATFASLVAPRARRPAGVLSLARHAWRLHRGGEALIGGDAMRASLRTLLGDASFATTRVPFAAAALDLLSGRRMIFAAGSLVDAVYASSAIPGLFEPLAFDEHLLVDGGWAEPVPVETCRHLGAIHVMAVDVRRRRPAEPPSSFVSAAVRADAAARVLLEERVLAEADVVIRADADIEHFADFSDPEALIAAGERAAEAALPEIRRMIADHESLFVRSDRTTAGAAR